ncbi:MAG: hypothetical protein H7831_10055 [Magnetococcus sp. WYHC-3]
MMIAQGITWLTPHPRPAVSNGTVSPRDIAPAQSARPDRVTLSARSATFPPDRSSDNSRIAAWVAGTTTDLLLEQLLGGRRPEDDDDHRATLADAAQQSLTQGQEDAARSALDLRTTALDLLSRIV